jgi:putative protein-disulfide isomerase
MKHILFSVMLFATINETIMAQDKLIYIGDPMCSWCYGFAPELEQIVEQYEGQVDIELVTGGLRPYFDKPISEMKDFLSHHWEDVHKASGQPFKYGILDRADLVYDTEPSCRAVVVVRAMDPKKEFEFFKLAQEAFYYHNKEMNRVETYADIVTSLGMDKDKFTQLFESEEYKTAVKRDFERAGTLGVSGFPTMLFVKDGEVHILSRGYTQKEKISSKVDQLMRQ